jgi:hypothetical protein
MLLQSLQFEMKKERQTYTQMEQVFNNLDNGQQIIYRY